MKKYLDQARCCLAADTLDVHILAESVRAVSGLSDHFANVLELHPQADYQTQQKITEARANLSKGKTNPLAWE